jgi:hypothetical protein
MVKRRSRKRYDVLFKAKVALAADSPSNECWNTFSVLIRISLGLANSITTRPVTF